jgi:hypothetical protein
MRVVKMADLSPSFVKSSIQISLEENEFARDIFVNAIVNLIKSVDKEMGPSRELEIRQKFE